MRTVTIGDTHGIAVLKIVSEIIADHDKFIFSGDYVDSFGIDNVTMKKNLLDIIELKKKYPDKIVLLWGNHDIHYLLGNEYYCSDCRPAMRYDYFEIFHSNEELFQFSLQIKDYLWTHAGLNAGWFEKRFKPFADEYKNAASISELLNIAFSKRNPSLFDVGYIRGGSYEVGGPLWCDKSELLSDPLKDYNQIVGHNRVKEFMTVKIHEKEIVFVDILESLEIINAEAFYYKEL